MTKGGSGKPKTLGRLIFGEKRKQHAPSSRHRSSTRHSGSAIDLASPTAAAATNKNAINLHDWAAWRTQLNEQMSAGMTERRSDLKQMRQFLQSNPFYQQHSRDPSNGRYNGVQLLFSIPHAKLKPEFLNDSQGGITNTNNHNEIAETAVYEPKKIRSNSDDRTTTSVNSVSAVQPIIMDKTISQLLPKGLIGNIGDFLQINEQMVAADGMRARRTARSSFSASDRIHSTLQKAVKDGNVLEKIKAFEMQAAAAHAESIAKLNSVNHRMQAIQSVAHRTLSPVIVHPLQNIISPVSMQEQSIRSNPGRYVHPIQHHRDDTQVPMHGHESRKGAHVLEPAHGDIILKRRTSSQKSVKKEDYSVTAISSTALITSQKHSRNHHHHHRTSASRSRHRQELTYDKRTSSSHEHHSHKHQPKQKGTITPSAKSSTRRRWLKGRKETPVETPLPTPDNQQETTNTKSNKSHKSKKKTVAEEKPDLKKVSKSLDKEKLSSDNNRVYGVPTANVIEQIKLDSPSKIEEECESDHVKDNIVQANPYIPSQEEDVNQNKECDTRTLRRPSKKHHQQRLSSTDGEILSKIDENPQSSRSKNSHVHQPEQNDADDKQSDHDVVIEDQPIKPTANITRHQSIVNLPNRESRRFQQQSTNTLRRHASQCSADELIFDRVDQINSNTLKKKSSPITLITRKNKNNRDEHLVYEAPHSEQPQPPVPNTHTLKKKRPFHTINSTPCANNNKQISKQILHAIMNSMNNNQEQIAGPLPTVATVNDEFFENGPLTNPEQTIADIISSA